MEATRVEREYDGAGLQCVDYWRPSPAHVGDTLVADFVRLQPWDLLSVGVVLVDRFARVLFANALARSMSVSNGAVRIDATLAARTPSHRFETIIKTSLDWDQVRAAVLPSPSGGRPMLAIVSPLRVQQAKHSGRREAVALVMLCDTERQAPVPIAWMMEAYRLTPAEARVACAIASGVGVAEVARQLRISSSTVRTHLAQVYGKTGTRSQTQLGRIVTMLGVAATALGGA